MYYYRFSTNNVEQEVVYRLDYRVFIIFHQIWSLLQLNRKISRKRPRFIFFFGFVH